MEVAETGGRLHPGAELVGLLLGRRIDHLGRQWTGYEEERNPEWLHDWDSSKGGRPED